MHRADIEFNRRARFPCADANENGRATGEREGEGKGERGETRRDGIILTAKHRAGI